MKPTYADVLAAHEIVKEYAHRTPVHTSRTLDRMTGARLFFKCENFQRGGAFKFRGAINAVANLSDEEKARGVITHSSGNHGQALAYAAKLFGIKATVVMTENSSPMKVSAVRDTYSAEVVRCENSLVARAATTKALVEEHGYTFVHPSNDPNVIAGAGTAALELLQEHPDIEIIITPVGGGGLLSGTSLAAKGSNLDIEVLAAEPSLMDDAYRSLHSGDICHNETFHNTVADGLKTELGDNTFAIIMDNVKEIIRVEEKEIIDATKLIWERMRLIVEPSSATVLAALLKIDVSDKRVGTIFSGGNVMVDRYFEEMEKQIA